MHQNYPYLIMIACRVLNDEMDDFSSPVRILLLLLVAFFSLLLTSFPTQQGSSNAFGYIATPANFIVPGKRPLSSISPAILEDAHGNFIFATGAAGGSRIITANFQVIHHYIDQGLTARKLSFYPP
jgi:gamma-glutamyltranspeptidase